MNQNLSGTQWYPTSKISSVPSGTQLLKFSRYPVPSGTQDFEFLMGTGRYAGKHGYQGTAHADS